MADLSDVSDAVQTLIASVIYPLGPTFPSIVTNDVKVYGGWPDPATLEADLGAATPTYHVSVFNLAMERNTTRYPEDEEETPPPAPTYALAVLGNAVTVTGAAPNPFVTQNIVIAIGITPYLYAPPAGKTAAQVATALAALIAVDIPGTVAVAGTITVPAPYRIAFARIGGVGVASREVSRQEKGFQVTIWTNNDDARRELGKLVTPTLDAEKVFQLSDGSWALMLRRSSTDSDKSERQRAYRRDLVYTVEYATNLEEVAPQLIALRTVLQNPPGTQIAETLG